MLFVFSSLVSAQTLGWNADVLIEGNAGNNGYDPQVAISGDKVVAVWGQWDESNWRIYSNYSTDGGADRKSVV